MTLSGIPGVTANAPKYVQKALLPDRTDAEAVAELTRSVVVAVVVVVAAAAAAAAAAVVV